jgi:hypothetical protein
MNIPGCSMQMQRVNSLLDIGTFLLSLPKLSKMLENINELTGLE